MCIIASSEIGKALPSIETIETMWYKNSDGAGFMFNKDGKVIIRKGFMKLSDFKTAIEELKNEIDVVNTAVVMHFRIGTHGGNTPENTHPFPVVGVESMLKKLTSTTDLGMAHNGIINSVKPRVSISDTMEYDLQILAGLKKLSRDFHKHPVCQKLIEETINGSRMCFLTPDGEITYIGNWDTDEKTGIKYSNSGYKSYDDWGYYKGKTTAKKKSYYYGWGLADDDDFVLSEMYHDDIMSPITNGFILTGQGEMLDPLEEDYFIDDLGNVYVYNWDFDVCIRVDDYTAFTNEGHPAVMDEMEADIIPWITEEDYAKFEL